MTDDSTPQRYKFSPIIYISLILQSGPNADIMKNFEMRNINVEPIYTFLTRDIYPKEFAELLDEFLYHYVQLLVQALNDDKTVVHENTVEFLHYIKYLRDILPECEK